MFSGRLEADKDKVKLCVNRSVLRAIAAMLLMGCAALYSDDFRPHIPRPGEAKANKKIPTGTRAFPNDEVLTFLEDHKLAEAPIGETTAAIASRLEKILPPGIYIFDSRCPLVREPEVEETELVQLGISCLGSKYKKIVSVDVPGTAPGAVFLKDMKEQRRIHAVMQLTSVHISGGRLHWIWKVQSLNYDNPYLEILRKTFPDLPEHRFVDSGHVSLAIADILARSIQEIPTAKSKEDLSAVLKPGMLLRFGRTCPLRVTLPPRQEPGEERMRLALEIVCMTGHPASRIVLLVPPGRNDLTTMESGSLIQADLRFGRVIMQEKYLSTEFDGITNVGKSP